MIQRVFLDPRFEKQMRLLSKGDKKATLASEQANTIIQELRKGQFSVTEAGSVTRHGELRLKGCIKYDLGSGYRLITLRRDQDLFVLYIGTHDDCHRWIENNRDLPLDMIELRSKTVHVATPSKPSRCFATQENDKNSEKELYDNLDDRYLRIIFSGLVQSNQTPS